VAGCGTNVAHIFGSNTTQLSAVTTKEDSK
jgi:hypothetical protein